MSRYDGRVALSSELPASGSSFQHRNLLLLADRWVSKRGASANREDGEDLLERTESSSLSMFSGHPR